MELKPKSIGGKRFSSISKYGFRWVKPWRLLKDWLMKASPGYRNIFEGLLTGLIAKHETAVQPPWIVIIGGCELPV